MAAPIRRIFYLSSEGSGREHEVFPRANQRVLLEIAEADAIVYGMGSLYTSICPSLVLPVGSLLLFPLSFAGSAWSISNAHGFCISSWPPGKEYEKEDNLCKDCKKGPGKVTL